MASTSASSHTERPKFGALPAAMLAGLLCLLSACSAPAPRSAPRLERLPASEAPSGSGNFDSDTIVSMVRAGESPAAIVARWRAAEPRMALRPAQLVELHARGVPLPTLDALAEAREAALRSDLDGQLAAQQAKFETQLAAERSRPHSCPAPGYWGPGVYGPWGYPGVWRGGTYWAW